MARSGVSLNPLRAKAIMTDMTHLLWIIHYFQHGLGLFRCLRVALSGKSI
jgi:hypothetical protein